MPWPSKSFRVLVLANLRECLGRARVLHPEEHPHQPHPALCFRFESLILSHHSGFSVTCECNEEEINDDDDDDDYALGVRVSHGKQASCLGFRFLRFGFRFWGFRFRVSCSGLRIFPALPESVRAPPERGKRPLRQLPPADELKDDRVGLAAAARAPCVLGFGFWVLGFGFWVWVCG